MRALVLGARGAVGRIVAEELRAQGHTVTPAGRVEADGWARIDLTGSDGLEELRDQAAEHDVVVNVSGIENPAVARGLSSTVFVDVSATAHYLDRLAREAPPGAGLVLGAGLVPGLSTILLDALDARPGDELDLAVILGGGEEHGAAAVAWTAGLAGRVLHDPPEAEEVPNLRETRRLPGPLGLRRHLRADFPDHLLVGARRDVAVRSYLAIDSRIATSALAVVGRFPVLRGLVRHAPHLGSRAWSLTALNRRTGDQLTATGVGQSHATGILTARMTTAAVRLRPTRAMTAADTLSLDEVRQIPGIQVSRP